jgi:Uroporphyrinogen decarboxylase (URO-D)
MALVNPHPFILDSRGQALVARHADWWQRKASLLTFVPGTPLGDLWLPLADGTLATRDMDVSPGLLDVDRLAGSKLSASPLEVHGDLFRVADPYGKVPWVEAVLGSPVRATIRGGSMRTHAAVKSWDGWQQLADHREEDWLDLLYHLTELLVEHSGGRYAVVQPTMRGPSDLAEALLGPNLMCLSMYDHPDELHAFLSRVTATFIEMLHGLLARIPLVESGYVSAFGIWAPGTVVRTQCDATAFLSARHYAEWFLPYDVAICEHVDYSFIHLHSCSLHIVDTLLDVKRPMAIQVTLEAEPKAPSLQKLVPIFRKILDRKPLLLEGQLTEAQVHWLQEQLPNGGLAITARQSEW